MIMKLFIDTANVDWIREMYDLGIICGATTNPTLMTPATPAQSPGPTRDPLSF